MFIKKKYNYYEVMGENRVMRQAVSNSKDIKERKPIEEFRAGNWVPVDWNEWGKLTLSYLTEAGTKELLKKCA